jgi:alkylated DNA repair dioxygenase AlkB
MQSFNLNTLNQMIDVIDKEKVNKNEKKQKINTFYGNLQNHLNVRLVTNYLDPAYSDKLFEDLKNIKYNSDADSMVRIMGMMIKIPRKQFAIGDPSIKYHFAGTSVTAYNWNLTDDSPTSKVARELKILAQQISRTASCNFNYILINNYIDQTNSIGYHRDDERELGDNPTIAGLSLGQERAIHFKSIHTDQVVKVPLPHNSLNIMYYPTNKYWKHCIPKSTQLMGQRISLTFRCITN